MPIGHEKAARLKLGGASISEYFGDGSDGSYSSSGTTYTVQNKSGSYDGDMLVRQYTDFNLTSGTITTDQPCRGMLIFVQGDCTISGSITMNDRGAFKDPVSAGVPSAGLQFACPGGAASFSSFSTSLSGTGSASTGAVSGFTSLSGNAKIGTLQRQGAAGGAGKNGDGADGTNGGTGQTGGGSSGGCANSGNSGSGSYGGPWGGGSGGGGCSHHASGGGAVGWSGAGGSGSAASSHTAGGGAGNPGGSGYNTAQATAGVGGLIVLIVGGTLSGSGSILAQGRQGKAPESGDGGCSGGGNILIMAVTNSFSGTISAQGGQKYVGGGGRPAGTAGNGSVQQLTVTAT
jgi:hypothetical protein